MKSENTRTRSLNTTEFIILALFAISLPLVEAPKNILWGLFLIVWLWRSFALRNFGRLERRWDLVLGGVLAAALISVVATPFKPQWRELGDILGYLSLAWMLGRSRLSERQLIQLLWAFVFATVIGLIHGYWFQHTYHKQWLQLNSVGEVNHSALYGGGIAIVVVVIAATYWRSAALAWRSTLALLCLALLSVMFTWGSRGALLTYLFGVVLFGLYFASKTGMRSWPAIVAALVVGAAATAYNPLVIQKTVVNLQPSSLGSTEYTSISSERVEGVHTASEIWRHYKLTGVGPANFSQISPAQVEQWVTQRGEKFVANYYLFTSHAHNLYFNTLAERGAFGEIALLALLACWTLEMIRRRPNGGSGTPHWLCWGAALSGWSIVFIGGIFNTSLHHEHGMLAMCFLGLLLGSSPDNDKIIVST